MFVFLTSLCMTKSRFIHITINDYFLSLFSKFFPMDPYFCR